MPEEQKILGGKTLSLADKMFYSNRLTFLYHASSFLSHSPGTSFESDLEYYTSVFLPCISSVVCGHEEYAIAMGIL